MATRGRKKMDPSDRAEYKYAVEMIDLLVAADAAGEGLTRDYIISMVAPIKETSRFHTVKRIAWGIMAATGATQSIHGIRVLDKRVKGEGQAYFLVNSQSDPRALEHELARMRDEATRVKSKFNRVTVYDTPVGFPHAMDAVLNALEGLRIQAEVATLSFATMPVAPPATELKIRTAKYGLITVTV